jgi:dolichyl-phosphate beta-glucosyltransferase
LDLSIVIPAYNEEKRLPETLFSIGEYLRGRDSLQAEVLVVSDGSTDQTVAVVEQFGAQFPFIRALSYPKNRGKGFALRHGVFNSKGALVLINDADGSTPIGEIERLEKAIADGAEVAIGSRALPSETTRVKTVWYRKIIGRTFATLVNLLIVPGIADTQCGFKLFTRKAAEYLFSRQRAERFSFDVELLFLARKNGFPITEVAVNWTNTPGSKVNLLKDSLAMFCDIIRFRWMAIGGVYLEPVGSEDLVP